MHVNTSKLHLLIIGLILWIILTLITFVMYGKNIKEEPIKSEKSLSHKKVFPEFGMYAYYPSWKGKTFPISRVPVSGFDAIMHAFVWPDKNGKLFIPQEFQDKEAVQAILKTNTIPMISIGGSSNSYGFKKLANHPEIRRQFVKDLAIFMDQHGYRGIDIDWEFPKGAFGMKALVELASDIKKEMPEVVLTIALPMTPSLYKMEVELIHRAFDRIFVMSYDIEGGWGWYAGHNAPLYKNPKMPKDMSIETILDGEYLKKWVPAGKLVLGIPVYGRRYETSEPYTPASGSQIVEHNDLPFDECVHNYDHWSQSPYLSCSGYYISYDNKESITEKIRYAKNRGLWGIFFWAIGQDSGKIIDNVLGEKRS